MVFEIIGVKDLANSKTAQNKYWYFDRCDRILQNYLVKRISSSLKGTNIEFQQSEPKNCEELSNNHASSARK